MISETPKPTPEDTGRLPSEGAAPGPKDAEAPVEIGGRDGPDPTRFGDWEKNGRCIDF
ncbi:DUF1674 domain-containing protein [Coralloluteibacterium stylophorae]|uniref:DUF1674 domain-containing protein n=1 Tax=Coralloluteibacterium stylophorae TaxID=1776034 RepID=A0A8J7VTA2_9GAMM|nr:DUF1674 domain-containing protein [Coralloluteibacterium stylophorae]MBS7455828.1 DUF1674 domain-containing protein [Coralloluteibacterium stylophorae]